MAIRFTLKNSSKASWKLGKIDVIPLGTQVSLPSLIKPTEEVSVEIPEEKTTGCSSVHFVYTTEDSSAAVRFHASIFTKIVTSKDIHVDNSGNSISSAKAMPGTTETHLEGFGELLLRTSTDKKTEQLSYETKDLSAVSSVSTPKQIGPKISAWDYLVFGPVSKNTKFALGYNASSSTLFNVYALDDVNYSTFQKQREFAQVFVPATAMFVSNISYGTVTFNKGVSFPLYIVIEGADRSKETPITGSITFE